MSISFSCKTCGKKLKAPEKAAGKTSKCPGCGAPVTCPEPVYEAEVVDLSGGDMPEILDDDIEILDDARDPYGVAGNPYAGPAPSERRRPCPACGEMVLATAIKCRFCGEELGSTLKSGKKKKRKGRDEDTLTGADWALGVLGVVANLVMAVIYMTQGNPKGVKLLIMSVCSNLYWLFALVVIRSLP